jgi:hypothetical protein
MSTSGEDGCGGASGESTSIGWDGFGGEGVSEKNLAEAGTKEGLLGVRRSWTSLPS